ncbi:glycosyltransferase [Aestuariivivens marinum]|uniref:glycosyltransferase n=1 Tax=Aestuariivivens marinum TaxID=2913555 RepID=UPI001F55EE8D|nr:glycosyltransferase [Aestuariivivens marinum]
MSKNILVAPLNWGLGHATRCIPVIKALLNYGYQPIIASDGAALLLLQKEFPNVLSIELPSYNISYTKNGKFFKWKIIKSLPRLLKIIQAEKKATKYIIETHKISGIISDNRFGVYSKNIPSVFITHQLNVLSGTTTWMSTKTHQNIIKNFNECWIPDVDGPFNLSGKLGHPSALKIPTKYIGPLSRFTKHDDTFKNDLLVLLSGPEPQRTILEKKLLIELISYQGKVIFVKGIIEKEQTIQLMDNMTVYNFMTSPQLEKTINESARVLSRSGYTTIMDLAKLNKKAFFIPTPGQFEQEYLAKRLTEQYLVPSCKQNEFKLEMLKKIDNFKGLHLEVPDVNFKTLFGNLF